MTETDQRPRWTCAHCGRASAGHREAIVRDPSGQSTPLCHPDLHSLPDCYRRVTVYGEPLGALLGLRALPPGVHSIRTERAPRADEIERRNLHSCGCGATWGGGNTCHCSGCHLTFTSPSAFDRHRPGRCLPPAEVGLATLRTSGNQQVWGVATGEPHWRGGAK